MVVSGYSAAQANHFSCVLSSQVSVQPFNSPDTARPAMSQREPVSWSVKGAVFTLSSRSNVNERFASAVFLTVGDSPLGSGCGAEYFCGGEASDRYAAAVLVGPYQRITRRRPSRFSGMKPLFSNASTG